MQQKEKQARESNHSHKTPTYNSDSEIDDPLSEDLLENDDYDEQARFSGESDIIREAMLAKERDYQRQFLTALLALPLVDDNDEPIVHDFLRQTA